jgi:hypothetical protein
MELNFILLCVIAVVSITLIVKEKQISFLKQEREYFKNKSIRLQEGIDKIIKLTK